MARPRGQPAGRPPDSVLPPVGLGDCPQAPPGGAGVCGVTHRATDSAGSWAPPAFPVGGRAGSAERAVSPVQCWPAGRPGPHVGQGGGPRGGSPRNSTVGG